MCSYLLLIGLLGPWMLGLWHFELDDFLKINFELSSVSLLDKNLKYLVKTLGDFYKFKNSIKLFINELDLPFQEDLKTDIFKKVQDSE